MQHQLIKSIIFTSILLSIQIFFPSVLSNALIKTPHGFLTAKNTTVEVDIIGYADKKSFVQSKVTNISISSTETITIITTQKGKVRAVPDQLFYDSKANTWIEAQNITIGTKLLDAQLNDCLCTNIKTITVPPTEVYLISTTYPHTFFVSEQELLTHNFFPLNLGFSVLFGGGIEFAGLTIGTTLLGTLFGIKLFKQKDNPSHKSFIIDTEMSATYGGHSPDPEDGKKNKKRKYNTISKSDFFKKEGKDYEHKQNGIYKRKEGTNGLGKKVKYIKWDHLHNDIEAYDKGGKHLGSYCPKTLRLYKNANPRNYIEVK